MNGEFNVTPWEVTGEIDYDLLVEKFGTKRIGDALMSRMASYGPIHPLLRRGVVYSHRDLEWVLDRYDSGEPFYLYTGRGPSGNTHLGHLMPWLFTKYLQETFHAPLYFQLTDDEKFLFNESLELKDTHKAAYENLLDIIAVGFDPKLTKIFLDTEYVHNLYPLAIKAAKRVTFSTAKAVFGFDNSTNIGSIFYTAMQTAPAFLGSELAGKNVHVLSHAG